MFYFSEILQNCSCCSMWYSFLASLSSKFCNSSRPSDESFTILGNGLPETNNYGWTQSVIVKNCH